MTTETDKLVREALDHISAATRRPESTYRVQLHRGFTFRDAAAIVPYLAELGVTHLYASPYFQAVPGSTHGYDVIDHNRLNDEIGTMEDYEALLKALNNHGLSHILDIVPNHVGVATNCNAWWNDVLEHGRRSQFAANFDIAWDGSPRPELHGKVLLPLLGSMYGQALEKGELKLVREEGKVWVRYYDRRFPIDPETLDDVGENIDSLNGRPGDARSFDRLDALLCRQHYRLAYWRVAPDEINYRRFFDVNDLAGISMEREEVFEAAHRLVLQLLAEGKVAGLRIDHPDGLYDPKGYLDRLQQHYVLSVAKQSFDRRGGKGQEWESLRPELLERISEHMDQHPTDRPPLYVVVEKILAIGEPLPDNWACDGTSGYDFLIMASSLFVDRAGERPLTELYRELTGEQAEFEDLVYEKKKQILRYALASELRLFTLRLNRIAQQYRGWRDFTLNGLIDALREVVACFPVYRTYISAADGVTQTDQQRVDAAIRCAIARNPRTEPAVFYFIHDVLLQRYPETFNDEQKQEMLHFAGKFQQLTSPATAKGIEDTAFYIFNRLVSLNEVGGEPGRFGIGPDQLHEYLADRQRRWPYALSAMSTHDTKRSEDVRGRLNVLSEVPDEWSERVRRWLELNARHRKVVNDQPAPHPNDEYLIYQTLLGAWPLEPADPKELSDFVVRVQAYMRKAMREAKVRTTWTDVNEPYEQAVADFVATVATDPAFLADFRPFHARISRLGLLNSLSQTLLRLAAPGVPDTYQGCELWDFSLVDPDNRRPVDYGRRRRLLDSLRQAPGASDADRATLINDLMSNLPDGRAKLYLTREVLRLRRRFPGLFTRGEYHPLQPRGLHADHLFAFERRLGESRAVVVFPRFCTRLETSEGRIDRHAWGDTSIDVGADGRFKLKDLFTGRPFSGLVAAADLLEPFPVALLMNDGA